MFDAQQTLNDPARRAAFVAGLTSCGTTKKEATRILNQRAKSQAADIEREKERRYAAFPELENRARETAARAARELEAAARALRHANALFFTLKGMVSADELSLVEIGEEQAGMYAERAQDEARYFAEGRDE
ncbi:hypothetical protein [Paraburkholderia tropica]|uniref:hypothetical protein n=1 Tax=Paraburkholderia tropica TaxID=92647 RepID=UPI002AB6BC98|nr:hypothetical protein [Paraburkholderia tropica]